MKRILFFATLVVLSFSVTKAATTFVPGVLQEEYWAGKVKGDIAAGTAGTPTFTTNLTSFEIPSDIANNYAVRVSGFFIPAASGNYSFNISADDTADLFLSTDDNPAHKRMIAQQPGWNATRLWVTDSGGGTDLQQRVSRTWQNASGAAPFATGIPLVAGTRYYIEAQFNEFGGGDNLAVSYQYPVPPATPTVDFPADGDPPNIDSSLIGITYTSPTIFTITNQPQNTTVFAGRSATFTVGVQSDAKVNGSPLSPVYQWRKGGVNILNATLPTLSYVASQSDSGAQFDCVVSFPPFTGFTDKVTSSAATLTVQAGIVVNGKLKQELWLGGTRPAVEDGSAGSPSTVAEFTSFHAPVGLLTPGGADFTYARRVSGLFTPTTSGNYVFFVCSDDDSDLFLSSDESPSKKRLIAQEQVWSADLQWQTSLATSPQAQRRSDQWVPAPNNPPAGSPPYSAGIPLVAGTKYYIEGVQHEGGGGDDFAATFKLLADVDPADGEATKLTGGLISYVTSPVTTGTITAQPTNVTVYETQPFSLTVVVQTDSELTPVYQWRKGGVNIASPLANVATYNVSVAGLTDAGSYDCLVTIPNSAGGPLTSTAATVTVQTAPFSTGYLKYEYFPGHTRGEVEGGTAGNPSFLGTTVGSDKSGAVTIGESGVTFADDYANRFSGFFIPPVTGDYNWIIACDDDGDLFLSTDDTPAKKRLVAQETGWSASRNWATSNGGSTEQKRSETYVDAAGNTPYAAGIHMIANNRYYIEWVHHEGGGGDNSAATFWINGEANYTDPQSDTPAPAPRLTGNVIGIKVPPQPLTITQQPQNTTQQEGRPATFTVAATTTGFYPPSYQWKKGGVSIAGATGASYTTPLLTLADNPSQFLCTVSIAGTGAIDSQAATLTVVPDTFPPQITGVGTLLKTSGAVEIGIGFDERLNPASAATTGNYKLSTGTVTGARYEPYAASALHSAVVLTTSGLAAGGNTTLTVTGVTDVKGNPMPATPKTLTVTSKLKWAGIGGNDYLDGALPADWDASLVPANYYDDAVAVGNDKDFDLISGGSQNWNNYDEETFVYEQVTGDFDRVMRVEYQDPSSQWARAGLMARKTLDEGVTRDQVTTGGYMMSQCMILRVNPTVGWTNGVAGNNSYEFVWRDADGGNYNSSGGAVVPTYPNAWVRLQRVGQVFTGFSSSDGVTWATYSTPHTFPSDSPMPNTLLVGPYYSPEMNNNGPPPTDTFFIGHSVVARFRDYAPFSAVTRPIFAPPIFVSAGSLRLQWTGSGMLQQTDSLSPANWTSAPNQANPQNVSTTTGSKYYRIAP